MKFEVGNKVKINAPGIYGNEKEGVVKELSFESRHPYKVEFETVHGFSDDCNYREDELELIEVGSSLAFFSVEELEAELEKRKESGKFRARIRALPVGTIFHSPFTAEPMVRVTEEEVIFGLSAPHPTRIGINGVSNDIVNPLVVIYQP